MAARRRSPAPLAEGLAPFSQEAEQSVIGAVLINPEVFSEVRDTLRPNDFYFLTHTYIWDAFETLDRQKLAIDFVTVVEQLRTANNLKVKDDDPGVSQAYLISLANNTPSAYHARAYAEIVGRAAKRRALMVFSDELKALAKDETVPTDRVFSEVEKLYRELIAASRMGSKRDRSMKAITQSLLSKIEARRHGKLQGLSTGLRDLDSLLGGLQAEKLYMFGGRPGMGKSALLATMIFNLVVAGVPVGLITLEMSDEEVVGRVLSMLTELDNRLLFSSAPDDQQWALIQRKAKVAELYPLYIADVPGCTPNELKANARRWHRDHGIQALFSDYIQLFDDDEGSENRTQELGQISRAHKAIAKELMIPVITAVQLSRGVEERANKRARLSDLRESGNLEQDADVIGFLYRDVIYNPNTKNKNVAELDIAKQRNGPTAKVGLFYDAARTIFKNLLRSEES